MATIKGSTKETKIRKSLQKEIFLHDDAAASNSHHRTRLVGPTNIVRAIGDIYMLHFNIKLSILHQISNHRENKSLTTESITAVTNFTLDHKQGGSESH